MKRRKNNKYLLLLVLLLAVSIGFALLQTTLKINGSATIKKQSWSVYWSNIANQSGVTPTSGPTLTQDSGDPQNTKVTWAVTLNQPGDYFEFTVDATNAGTIDAMIAENGISNVVSPTLPANPAYIKYSVTYADGTTAIEPYHLLPKATVSGNTSTPTTETYKVRVYYDEAAATPEIVNGMNADATYTFTFGVTYVQATGDAIPKPVPVWTLPQGKTANTLAAGDEICLSTDSTQCFNFIRYDGNDVVMLAKYNLNVGNNAKGTATNKQDSDVRGGLNGLGYGTVAFSTTNYWYDSGAGGLKPEYGSDYPVDVYDAENYAEAPGESNYSVAYYVEEYKDILETAGATIKSARLLTNSEAVNYYEAGNGDITNTTFWLGSTYSNFNPTTIDGGGDWGANGYNYDNVCGVRPVVVVEKSNL